MPFVAYRMIHSLLCPFCSRIPAHMQTNQGASDHGGYPPYCNSNMTVKARLPHKQHTQGSEWPRSRQWGSSALRGVSSDLLSWWFVLDITYSMGWYIAELEEEICRPVPLCFPFSCTTGRRFRRLAPHYGRRGTLGGLFCVRAYDLGRNTNNK